MKKLVHGLHHFQRHVFSDKQELFERLKEGQSPDALFITCSDSRIDPTLITQTEPGDIFILRNAGNIIPPHGAANGGEAATIEYAVKALNVKDIIVCGHSQCGAMTGLHHQDQLDSMPTVQNWLSHAEATRCVVNENYPELDGEEKINVTIQENVLIQLENLRTLPSVAARLVKGDLNLHGWVYKFETGEIYAYNPEEGQFLKLSENPIQVNLSPRASALPSI